MKNKNGLFALVSSLLLAAVLVSCGGGGGTSAPFAAGSAAQPCVVPAADPAVSQDAPTLLLCPLDGSYAFGTLQISGRVESTQVGPVTVTASLGNGDRLPRPDPLRNTPARERKSW